MSLLKESCLKGTCFSNDTFYVTTPLPSSTMYLPLVHQNRELFQGCLPVLDNTVLTIGATSPVIPGILVMDRCYNPERIPHLCRRQVFTIKLLISTSGVCRPIPSSKSICRNKAHRCLYARRWISSIPILFTTPVPIPSVLWAPRN